MSSPPVFSTSTKKTAAAGKEDDELERKKRCTNTSVLSRRKNFVLRGRTRRLRVSSGISRQSPSLFMDSLLVCFSSSRLHEIVNKQDILWEAEENRVELVQGFGSIWDPTSVSAVPGFLRHLYHSEFQGLKMLVSPELIRPRTDPMHVLRIVHFKSPTKRPDQTLRQEFFRVSAFPGKRQDRANERCIDVFRDVGPVSVA